MSSTARWRSFWLTLIGREVRRAGIDLSTKLAMRSLSEIYDETTLIYSAAGGRPGRPRVRCVLVEMDETQRGY